MPGRIILKGKRMREIVLEKDNFLKNYENTTPRARAYYDIVLDELLSYKGIQARISWKYDIFYYKDIELLHAYFNNSNLLLCFCGMLEIDEEEKTIVNAQFTMDVKCEEDLQNAKEYIAKLIQPYHLIKCNTNSD